METKSFRIEDDLNRDLENWAETIDRSQGSIINEAIRNHLDHQRWIGEIVQRGLDEIQAGTARLIPHEEVVKRFRSED